MTMGIRLTRALYEHMLGDLRRPHEHAYERVGFVSAKTANISGEHALVLLTEYRPVLDEQYIPDPYSGARINSAAIREAMQRALDTGDGIFHVHMHEGRGKPGFSTMDAEETPRIVAGLRTAAPEAPHGMLLLSGNHCTAWVWLPGAEEPVTPAKVSVAGYPMALLV